MNKKQLIAEVRARIKYLLELEKRLSASIEKVKGSLICSVSRKSAQFYWHVEGQPRVSLMKDDNHIAKLAEKRYEEKLLAASRRERSQLESCLSLLEKPTRELSDISMVRASLPEQLKPFISKYNADDDESYAKKWQDRKLSKRIRDEFIERIDPLKTKRGEFVRSKSELIIADKLYIAGVPYFYEARKDIPHSRDYFFPDFLVLNKRKRKEYLWEHLGLLDRDDYMRTTQRKLSEYAKMGYFPGKNLIITFESSGVPLDVEYVDSLIDEFLK